MNKLGKAVASVGIAGALAFGAVGCSDKPPKDFKQRCDAAGGHTERDHDSLGMAPMAFDIGGPKPRPAAPKAKAPVRKVPSAQKPAKKARGWSLGSGHGHSTKKAKKHKSADDNEWVCMKNGVELFDEE